MKIELKHITPYLPYGLGVVVGLTRVDLTAVSLDSKFVFTTTYLGSRDKQMKEISQIKPILRPLSDLTHAKLESDMNDKDHYSHIDYTTRERENIIKEHGRTRWLEDIPYIIVEYLFKNHFDVFELIPKGLAININTLPK